MKSNPRVNQKDYDLLKNLIKLEISNREIVRLTGRSRTTIERVKSSSDFESYQAIVRASNANNRGQQKPEMPAAPATNSTGIESRLDTIIELITKISNLTDELAKLTAEKPAVTFNTPGIAFKNRRPTTNPITGRGGNYER